MVATKVGQKVYISPETLTKKQINIIGHENELETGFVVGKVVSLHSGRTWNVVLSWGETIQIASREWDLAPVPKIKSKRKRSKQAKDSDDEDCSEDDCGGESEGEEAQGRAQDAAPTKRDQDTQWVEATVTTDIRETRGHMGKRAHLSKPLKPGEDSILALFLRFFPIQMYEEHLEQLADQNMKYKTQRHEVPWDKGTFLRFLGLLIKFTVQPVPNIMWHWNWPHDVPEIGYPGVKHLMREVVFKRYWALATIPGIDAAPLDAVEDVDTRSPEYKAMESLLEECNDTWQEAWVPGDYIVADECMIFWQGTGEVHITFQGRKPTNYGMELKALACSDGKIILVIELVEGAAADAQKEYRDQVGATVATTLRLAYPYKGTGRTLVADAWFGSCNTAEWVTDELGLYVILAVKTGHAGFPKEQLKAAICGERFSYKCLKTEVALEVGNTEFYASGFMDKKPLLLVANCGTTFFEQEVTRYRNKFSGGAMQKSQYNVSMPYLHDTYRKRFNAVDLFNRDCYGTWSVQFAIQTKSWYKRLFLALLGMCETNALHAYRKCVGPMDRYSWLVKLSDKLINNPYLDANAPGPSAAPFRGGVCGNQVYYNHHMACRFCKASTHWKCACGLPVCRSGAVDPKGKQAAKCDGYFRHLRFGDS